MSDDDPGSNPLKKPEVIRLLVTELGHIKRGLVQERESSPARTSRHRQQSRRVAIEAALNGGIKTQLDADELLGLFNERRVSRLEPYQRAAICLRQKVKEFHLARHQSGSRHIRARKQERRRARSTQDLVDTKDKLPEPQVYKVGKRSRKRKRLGSAKVTQK